eukprot:CAMPEP_0177659492 /NCGR_PEP_ID=MMETSP0447-20121125/17474_1 /TAXON_ID=0 /ORGANISM="Stygamoeba regulata, Strain BSH-02190019" /LENGTH=712 /DNA_ID=CAMNT_0019164371 /DNA_START=64 /DNA_END=2199 /DNA_ORIENTATION=+
MSSSSSSRSFDGDDDDEDSPPSTLTSSPYEANPHVLMAHLGDSDHHLLDLLHGGSSNSLALPSSPSSSSSSSSRAAASKAETTAGVAPRQLTLPEYKPSAVSSSLFSDGEEHPSDQTSGVGRELPVGARRSHPPQLRVSSAQSPAQATFGAEPPATREGGQDLSSSDREFSLRYPVYNDESLLHPDGSLAYDYRHDAMGEQDHEAAHTAFQDAEIEKRARLLRTPTDRDLRRSRALAEAQVASASTGASTDPGKPSGSGFAPVLESGVIGDATVEVDLPPGGDPSRVRPLVVEHWYSPLTPGFWIQNVGLRNVVLLGLSFLFVFTAFSVAQGFATTLVGRLGSISLGLLYLCFSVTNLFGSYLVNRLGHRWSLVIGGGTYAIYVACNIYIKAYILLPASALIGMGAAVIWTAQGAYLSDNSSVTTLGLFSGVFWFIFQCNYVIGPLTAAQLINDNVPQSILYSVLTVVCILGVLSFFALSYSDRSSVRVLHPLDQLRLFGDSRIQHMLCMMIFSGITQSYYFGVFPQQVGKYTLGYILTTFGVSDAISSMIAGKASDVIGRKPVIIFGSVVCFIGMALDWMADSYTDRIYMYFIIAVLFGMSDACYNTQIYAVLGHFFKDESELAFGVFRLVQATSTGAVFFLSLYLTFRYLISVMLLFLVMGVIFFMLMDRFVAAVDSKNRITGREDYFMVGDEEVVDQSEIHRTNLINRD